MADGHEAQVPPSSSRSNVKQQHYVPQLLLRNFARPDNKDQVFTFEKATSKVYSTSINKTGSANRYNEVEIRSGVVLEHALGSMECDAAPVFAEIIRTKRLDRLTDEQRYKVSLFIAIQIGRTPTFREEMAQFSRALGERIGKANWEAWKFEPVSKEDLKWSTAMFAAKSQDMAQFIYDKVWFLHEATGSDRFVIGDHPVAQWHSRNMTGNHYYVPPPQEPGCQMNLPISPKLTLSLWCPTILNKRGRFTLEQLKVLRARRSPLSQQDIAFLGEYTYPATAGNVDHLNFIQIARANARLYGATDQFDDLRAQIAADATLSTAPQMIYAEDVLSQALDVTQPLDR